MRHPSIRTIGLTGGIACGKSMVSEYLAHQHRCRILDADIYARDAVTPPSSILGRIEMRYGRSIVNHDGHLNREALGQIIFADDRERQWLEAQIHPYVQHCLIAGRDRHFKTARINPRPLVMVVPLLFESGMDALVTDIWVVSCTPEQQLQRLMERNGLSRDQAQARIQSQWSLSDKVKRAAVVIDNSGDRITTYHQVDLAIEAHAAGTER